LKHGWSAFQILLIVPGYQLTIPLTPPLTVNIQDNQGLDGNPDSGLQIRAHQLHQVGNLQIGLLQISRQLLRLDGLLHLVEVKKKKGAKEKHKVSEKLQRGESK